MPGAGSSAGENEYQPENTGYAGRVPYFLVGLPLGEETRGRGRPSRRSRPIGTKVGKRGRKALEKTANTGWP